MPFSPPDISNCTVWLHADGLSLNDGDTIQTWTDDSGAGNDFTEAFSGNRPVFKTNIVNGKPVARFAAASQQKLSASSNFLSGYSGATLFVVSKHPGNSTGYKTLAIIRAFSDADPAFYILNLSNSYSVEWRLHYSVGEKTLNTDETSISGTWWVAALEWDGTDLKGYRNGTERATTAAGSGTIGSGSTPRIGDGASDANFMDGDIAEVVLYSRGLNTSERDQVTQYLGDKYGISVVTSGATVNAPVATATASALVPTIPFATVLAPLATATGAALVPTISIGGAQVDAPVAQATASANNPGVAGTVYPPLSTAAADALVPSVVLGASISSPVATASASALPAHFDVLIAPETASAAANGSPPITQARVAAFGSILRAEREPNLGHIIHTVRSPTGEMDYPYLQNWEAEEEAPGGFVSAIGTVPARLVRLNPHIYRAGSVLRSFHAESGSCVWAGRLLEPTIEGEVARIEAEGWSVIYGEKIGRKLFYQRVGTQGWVPPDTYPFSKDVGFELTQFIAETNWSVNITEGMLMFHRTPGTEDLRRHFAEIGTFTALYVPGLRWPGLTRFAFKFRCDGYGFDDLTQDQHIRNSKANDLVKGSRTYNGDFTFTVSNTGGTTYEGPAVPEVLVYAGHFNEETGESTNLFQVLHVFTIPLTWREWDLDLQQGVVDPAWTINDASQIHLGHSGQVVGPLPISDPGTFYSSITPSLSESWEDFLVRVGDGAGKPINFILVAARNNRFHTDVIGGSFRFVDDPTSRWRGQLTDIRVNGEAVGDSFSAGELVRALCAEMRLPDVYVDTGGVNVLPYETEAGVPFSDSLDFAALIGNRRWRILDSGARPVLQYGRYGETRWSVQDERETIDTQPLRRYDTVHVPYQVNAQSAESSVTVRERPSPLPRPQDFGQLSLDHAFRNSDMAEGFGQEVLDYLLKQRWGGSATQLQEALDENGNRESAHLIHAGDTLRWGTGSTGHMRIAHLRRTYAGVDLEFDDSTSAIDRLAQRRDKRLIRRHAR